MKTKNGFNFKDKSFCPERIEEPYILEAYIPEKYCLKGDGEGLYLSMRNELRHVVGGVAAHTLRYFSKNKEEFNVFRARGQSIWWMRHIYNSFDWWRGYVVNAEGERKNMPMLYVGETFGSTSSYTGKEVDIVLSAFENPKGIIDSDNTGGTIFAVGYSQRHSLFNSPDKYAAKCIVGPKYVGSGVNVKYPAKENLRLMAEHMIKTKGENIDDYNIQKEMKNIKVVILNRERHIGLIGEVKKLGAHVTLVNDDDLSPTFALTRGDVDLIIGVGGVPEGILSAMLLENLGGEMTLRILPDEVAHNENMLIQQKNWDIFKIEELEILRKFHVVKPGTEKKGEIPYNKIFTSKDLARSNDVVFTASIIKETPWIKDSHGRMVPGVEIKPETGEIFVHVIRVAENRIEITPVVYKTPIAKFKERLKHYHNNVDEHLQIHIHLAKAYAEFGLFEMAEDAIKKTQNDDNVNEQYLSKSEVYIEYFKGLKVLTNYQSNALDEAIKHFKKVFELDKDNNEGLRPKRMLKRIYEYMGDAECQTKRNENAIKRYKKALRYGQHELKLYRKINSANMQPILTKYFDKINEEYNSRIDINRKSKQELNKIKLKTALDIYYGKHINPVLPNSEPWLIFFRRTVMHNISLSYKLALLVKLRELLVKLNHSKDNELMIFLHDEFSIDKKDCQIIINYRLKIGKFNSISELYHSNLGLDVLAKLLIPNVRVESYNWLESAHIPATINAREAVERRYKNILDELDSGVKKPAQEFSYAVAESYHYIGITLYDVGDSKGSIIYYWKAIDKFKEIIENFNGITPVNAQYRIGNMYEELSLLFYESRKRYFDNVNNAISSYLYLIDKEKFYKMFGSIEDIAESRIEQAKVRVKNLKRELTK